MYSIIEYQCVNDSTYEFLSLILKIVEKFLLNLEIILIDEKNIYFSKIENPSMQVLNLIVKRLQDERDSSLYNLNKLWGRQIDICKEICTNLIKNR